MMAWVTLEDLTGTIELVLFPRTWEKYQFALDVGGVILAEGKVDAQSNPFKVLVDDIRTEIKLTEPAQLHLRPAEENEPVRKAAAASARVMEPMDSPEPFDEDDGPPPPEDPPDWEAYRPAPARAVPEVTTSRSESAEEPPAEEEEPLTIDLPVSAVILPVIARTLPVDSPTPKLPPPMPVRLLPLRVEPEHAPQMITVILRPTGDPRRDIRRISRLHGTFISFPGKDKFAFQIFENERGYMIEFPNDTTLLCEELMDQIKNTVGEANIRIEPILFQ
jgi:DNA polymerase-3 subunit alpha